MLGIEASCKKNLRKIAASIGSLMYKGGMIFSGSGIFRHDLACLLVDWWAVVVDMPWYKTGVVSRLRPVVVLLSILLSSVPDHPRQIA